MKRRDKAMCPCRRGRNRRYCKHVAVALAQLELMRLALEGEIGGQHG